MAAEDNNQVTDLPEGVLSCSPAAYIAVQMALKAAIELNVFDIMADSGPPGTQLSVAQIASKIPAANPNAVTPLHCVLRFLAVNSFLTTSLPPYSDKEGDRLFGLTPLTAGMMVRENGGALPMYGSFLLLGAEKELFESFDKLKDFILDPQRATCPFEMVYGVGYYDYLAKRPDSKTNILFDQSMSGSSKLFLGEMMAVYRGFDEVVELMNVGGNDGSLLECLISVYPNIKGINFDLPHVIARAPLLKGVRHVAGDMFESLPNSKTILMKWILHNWSDERCVKLLRNCWRALPKEGGKVIVVEKVIPRDWDRNKAKSMEVISMDFFMLAKHGGKERTISEFHDLAAAGGFRSVEVFPVESYAGFYVLEFVK